MAGKAKSEPEQEPEKSAEQAELDRQQAQFDAVADANENDLPKLGGPNMNPGAPPEDEG